MTPLNTCKVSGGIVIWRLQPVVAIAILPGGDAAPADHTGVKVALIEEELAGGRTEVGTLEIALVAGSVKPVGFLLYGLRVGILGEDDVRVICQPLAGVHKRELQVVHHQVNGAAMGIANVTLVGVLAHIEVQAGMPVVVERAKRRMSVDREAKPLSNSLDGECSELFKIKFIYHMVNSF